MTKDDISVFEKHGLSVVTNPGSNAKLASGVAPISKIYEKKELTLQLAPTDLPAIIALICLKKCFL